MEKGVIHLEGAGQVIGFLLHATLDTAVCLVLSLGDVVQARPRDPIMSLNSVSVRAGRAE